MRVLQKQSGMHAWHGMAERGQCTGETWTVLSCHVTFDFVSHLYVTKSCLRCYASFFYLVALFSIISTSHSFMGQLIIKLTFLLSIHLHNLHSSSPQHSFLAQTINRLICYFFSHLNHAITTSFHCFLQLYPSLSVNRLSVNISFYVFIKTIQFSQLNRYVNCYSFFTCVQLFSIRKINIHRHSDLLFRFFVSNLDANMINFK